MNVSIAPIPLLRDRDSKEGRVQTLRRPVDSKVRGVVLDLICGVKGGLFASTSAPQIVIDFLPAIGFAQLEYSSKEKRKPRLKKTPLARSSPIGLRMVDQEGWLNALMQVILFVPGFVELFFFAPRSFYPFQEFIDQYYLDQQEGRALSTANGSTLFRFLNVKLPSLSLHEVFEFLIFHLHPPWKIYGTFEEAFKMPKEADLFIAEPSLKRQVFTERQLFCYDLDAFIELRPDGATVNFIAYVKVDGVWYQCDDDRITQLRSNCLSLPLSRAALVHYKRIDFSTPT